MKFMLKLAVRYMVKFILKFTGSVYGKGYLAFKKHFKVAFKMTFMEHCPVNVHSNSHLLFGTSLHPHLFWHPSSRHSPSHL